MSGFHSVGRLSFVIAALGLSLLLPATALAGELLFGQKPLAVDDAGKITDAGRAAAVKELENTGADAWTMHLWAELDGAKKGPIAVDFFDELNGERIKIQTLTHQGHAGGKYLSAQFKLDGGKGFNKEHDYEVELAQGTDKKRTILASAHLLLFKKEDREKKAKEEEEARRAEEEAAEEAALAESVPELEEEEVAIPEFDEPPPVSSGRCSAGGSGAPGTLGMTMLLLAVARRRNAG